MLIVFQKKNNVRYEHCVLTEFHISFVWGREREGEKTPIVMKVFSKERKTALTDII